MSRHQTDDANSAPAGAASHAVRVTGRADNATRAIRQLAPFGVCGHMTCPAASLVSA